MKPSGLRMAWVLLRLRDTGTRTPQNPLASSSNVSAFHLVSKRSNCDLLCFVMSFLADPVKPSLLQRGMCRGHVHHHIGKTIPSSTFDHCLHGWQAFSAILLEVHALAEIAAPIWS